MKRLITFFALIAVWASSALAHDFEVNGIYYVKNSDGNSVRVSYKGTSNSSAAYSGSVTIPPSVAYSGKTYDVTSIGDYAFYNCSGLTSVTIPNSVTSIGEKAFAKCSDLTSVTIGNSVTSIGSSAFQGCNKVKTLNTNSNCCASISRFPDSKTTLNTLTLGNSVTSIGSYAFYGCSGLTSVTIGSSVKSIGSYAFYGCSVLKTVNWRAKNCEDFTEDKYAPFYGLTGITAFNFGNNVQKVPAYLCNGLTGLTSVTIPNSVTSIEKEAFGGCSGLTKVEISDIAAWCRISFSNYNSNPLYYAHHLYMSGSEIKDLVIPNSVTSIGGGVFRGCSGLKSVTIPSSVKSIGGSAFYGCSGLTSVTIPNSVTSIGDNTFCNCSGLKSVTIPNSVTEIGSHAFCLTGLTSVIIPNTVKIIHYGLFASCSDLKSVTIPNSVTVICLDAFISCTSLKSVTIPNSVTSIEKEAFSGCSGLTSVTIPNSVTSIGEKAFAKCSDLTSVTIGNSVTSIGSRAFYNCSGLKTVNWNAKNCAGFEYAGSAPFFGLTGITSFNFGNEVEKIPAYLCYQLSGLTSVTIGNSVTSIGIDAFYDTPWYNNQPDGLVYISNVAYRYKGTMPSNTSIAIKEGTVSISPYCFSDCSGLTSVTIPNSVTSIGDYAFKGCGDIHNLTWNAKKCSSMGNMSKTNISSVTIGDGVETLPADFVVGSKITSVTFPNSVTSIGDYAFSNCSGLTSIINPYNIKTIGAGAFQSTKWFDNQPSNTLVYVGNVAYKFKGTLKYYNYSFAFRDGTVSISPRCFYEESLTTCNPINIPNTVKVIGESAFYRLNPQSITIGTSVESIGKNAFVSRDNSSSSRLATLIWNAKNCSSNGNMTTSNISTVIIGNSVETLPARFVEGSQITDVTIPGSVKTIGDSAFASCSKLSTVTNYALTPQSINESVFQNVDVSFCTLYVPAESNGLYASANVWKDFFIQNAGVEGVEVDKSTKEIEGYYNLHGIRIKEPIRGQVNIVRYSDGSAEKLVIKE